VARSVQLKLIHYCPKQEGGRVASLAKLVEHQLCAPVNVKRLANCTRQNAIFTTLHSRREMSNSQIKVLIC